MPGWYGSTTVMKMAFNAGHDASVEAAGSGELPVETLDLRYALYAANTASADSPTHNSQVG